MRELCMEKHRSSGKLITFCGLDGCGKTTMIEMLKTKLEDDHNKVLVTKQPTSFMRKTDIFRNYMDSCDHSSYEYRSLSLMAAADRLQHSKNVILPALKEGFIVISDRYFYSCLANLRARGYYEDTWIYEIAKDIPMPDFSFFLDVPVRTAVKRVRSRPQEKDRYIDMDLQYRLRREYVNICNENKGFLIDSKKEIEDTFFDICQCIFD